MGNDTSKTTIENQQMMLQLQQQILNNNQNSTQVQYPIHNIHNRNEIYYDRNGQLPVISAAELQRDNRNSNMNRNRNSNMNMNMNMNNDTERYNSNERHNIQRPNTLFDILNNKKMMDEVEKNPSTKRKLLEKLISDHRHIMTTTQVQRINQMLEKLIPAENNYTQTQHIQNNQNRQNTQQYANAANAANANTNMHINSADSNEWGFNQGTTRQDSIGKELQTMQQLNTIDALSKHYKTEAEREEAEFKIAEDNRRREFLEKQKTRRLNYHAKLTDLDKHNIDALKVFQLTDKYTLEELKQAYKKLAIKMHPDRPGGNTEQFQLITKCYMSLLEKHKNRESDRQFNDLKKGSNAYLEDQANTKYVNKDLAQYANNTSHNDKSNNKIGTINKDKFDANLFNKIYEQNKLWESGDDGYGSWFSSENDEPPTELFSKKFNLNVFNSTFEDYKGKSATDNSKQIKEYNDPQELVSCSTGFTDIDIFARKIEDFSKPLPIAGVGGNKTGKDLAYTDLKTAYTVRGAFIDPNKVEYKTYKNIDELEKARGQIKFDMTPDQMRDYEMKKYKEQEDEAQRQHLIRQRDNIVSNTYGKTHEKMLGNYGTAPS